MAETLKFRHAGDIGDIIYGLPVMKFFGGGDLLIEAARYTRQMLTPDRFAPLVPLLKEQPYVKDVRAFNGSEVVHYNLNDFRARMMGRSFRIEKSLCDWQLETHNVPFETRDTPWLQVKNPHRIAPVIINRTRRYQNPMFPWRDVMTKYGKDAVFVGLQDEHEAFCNEFGSLRWCRTEDHLEVARVIAACDLFIGNQSSCYAIAEGLKKAAVLEVWLQGPNCIFHRKNAFHGRDQLVTLPNLPGRGGKSAAKEGKSDVPASETSKHRHLVEQYCSGNGVDLGSSGDPVVPHAIQVDLPSDRYRIYNTSRPSAPIHWRGDAVSLPFRDGVLDFAASAHLIEDLPDWTPALREWDRVLKRGGYLIISCPDHQRFRAHVARGKSLGQDWENCSHKTEHLCHKGVFTELLGDKYDVLYDDFVNQEPTEYSLLWVGRKK